MRDPAKPSKLSQRQEPGLTDARTTGPVSNGEKLWPIYRAWQKRDDVVMDGQASSWPPGKDPNRRVP